MKQNENYEKKYKEALDRAKICYRYSIFDAERNALKTIFPELQESEDERIRKELIDGVRQIRCKNGITREQMLAWLEKQKEQKPEWSEEDEYLMDETIQHLEQLIRIDKAKHCGVDVQYYQRDIDWLKSLRPQPKQEWSEEDSEKRRKIKACICYALANIPNEKIKDFGISLRDCLDYVVPVDKSLREPVDLEKEIDNYMDGYFTECQDGTLLNEGGSELQYEDVSKIAKYFYELGRKGGSK